MSTMRDVATLARVSISTVSHVINGTRNVSPGTRQRVINAMQQVNYRHNALASSLRSNQTRVLGVLVPNSANPFFAEVISGIEAACFDEGYNILMGNANDDPERELAYLEVLISRQVDGILLVSAGAHRTSLELINGYQKPVVMVDRTSSMDHVDEIYTDNYNGGLLATQYLLDLGHQRVACISGPSFLTPSADRVRGYKTALEQADIAVDESLILSGNFQHDSGYTACQALLEQPHRPTAIFACNDLMAVGALCAIQEVGLRVPEDISVIGYDDIPLAAYTSPRLTTIAQPAQELGKLAAKKLLHRLENRTDGNGSVTDSYTVLPVHLKQRESCGPPPK